MDKLLESLKGECKSHDNSCNCAQGVERVVQYPEVCWFSPNSSLIFLLLCPQTKHFTYLAWCMYLNACLVMALSADLQPGLSLPQSSCSFGGSLSPPVCERGVKDKWIPCKAHWVSTENKAQYESNPLSLYFMTVMWVVIWGRFSVHCWHYLEFLSGLKSYL